MMCSQHGKPDTEANTKPPNLPPPNRALQVGGGGLRGECELNPTPRTLLKGRFCATCWRLASRVQHHCERLLRPIVSHDSSLGKS